MRNDKGMGGVDRSQQTYIFEISLSFCLSFFRFVWLIFFGLENKRFKFLFQNGVMVIKQETN